MKAKLRVCASCAWIFKDYTECPKCGFAHYSARYVYGNRAYRYSITQKPWLDRSLDCYMGKLLKEISETNQFKHKTKTSLKLLLSTNKYKL